MSEIVPFAETNFRNKKHRFGIKTDDRRRHMYVVGKTGMGKTNLLRNMVIDDIRSHRGVAVVDPHGEFAEELLDFVPKERIQDVIYFNPADLDYPIAFNAVESVAPEYRHLITDGLVGVFQKLWAETWGPRLEYVLRNAILALLEVPDATLLGIMRILSDKEYRKWVVSQLKDPVVRAFWVDEFSRYPDRFQAEAIAPIQNKVGQFLANPLIRNIVGQTKTSFDMREAMDARKILIMNLSKGRIGEGTSRLLGAMMITKLQLAAMSRIDTPEDERQDFFLYVDEFQNFATVSFANILSEARKYRLNIILAHQYIAQLESDRSTVVRDAVFGNVGTIISFRIGGADAEFLEKEFEPEFMINDLVNLAKYHIYLKLMIDGVASKAFSATTLPPYERPDRFFREEIIEHTRRKYGSNREQVEGAIAAWAGPIESPVASEAAGPASPASLPLRKSNRELFDAVCSICGTPTKVPFQPDNKRPIYCEKCLQEIRAGLREPLPIQRGTASLPGQDQRPSNNNNQQPRRDNNRDGNRHKDRRGKRVSHPPREAEVVVRDTSGEAISLNTLAPRPEPSPHLDKAQHLKKDRPTPDLSGLRDLLGDFVPAPTDEEEQQQNQRTDDPPASRQG